MKPTIIQLPSDWGNEVRHRYFTGHTPLSTTLVVLFPGLAYSCELPLLYYAQQSAIEHHYDVLALEYGDQSARTDFKFEKLEQLVEECLQAIAQVSSKYDQYIFISKSLGTVIAGEVSRRFAEDTVQHIYLTPIELTVPYIKETSGYVIYGTRDEWFSEQSIRHIQGLPQIRPYPVLEASHNLEVDTVAHSLLVMREIVLLYKSFMEQHQKE